MPKISVGRVENPDDLDLDPVEAELVGYTLDKKEVAKTFLCRPVIPAGAQLEIIRYTDAQGNIPLKQVVDYLDECLLEEDAQAFREFIHDRKIQIEPGTVVALYRELTDYYASRPTMRRSGSASTGSPARRTSRAAASSRASGRSRPKR